MSAADMAFKGRIGIFLPPCYNPINSIMAKELNFLGSFRFANVLAAAPDLVVTNKVNLTTLISAVLPLSNMQKAMDLAVGKNEIVKVQIAP
jgi:L-idonate 5-dehydrogenase